MSCSLSPRDQLQRLQQRVDALGRGLARQYGRADHQATAAAKAAEPRNSRARFFGPGSTAWPKRAEARRQAYRAQLLQQQAASLRAELARFERLTAAAAQQARRLGVNEPWQPEGAHVAQLLRQITTTEGTRDQ